MTEAKMGKEGPRIRKQVDRLVKALAGKKQMSMEGTRLHIAEKIREEQISIGEHAIRQWQAGRVYPQDERILKILVRIGAQEAELPYTWAESLLIRGNHHARKQVLAEVYGKGYERFAVRVKYEQVIVTVRTAVIPLIYYFALRTTIVAVGTLPLLAVWTFFISPFYPPIHEPIAVVEMLWGTLIGIGLAIGLHFSDIYQAKKCKQKWGRFYYYLVLPLGGCLGASIWHFLGIPLFNPDLTSPIQSSFVETFTFGIAYSIGFVFLIVLLLRKLTNAALKPTQVLIIILLVVLSGGCALGGHMLVFLHPGLSNQEYVDGAVGLTLRLGLAIVTGICFPPLLRPQVHILDKQTWIPWQALYLSGKSSNNSVENRA